MRVALYTRASNANKGQDSQTQLRALREYSAQRGWEVVSEYEDVAPANNLRNRKQWGRLMDRCAIPRPGFNAILVVNLDRVCRSIKDMSHEILVMATAEIQLVPATNESNTPTA